MNRRSAVTSTTAWAGPRNANSSASLSNAASASTSPLSAPSNTSTPSGGKDASDLAERVSRDADERLVLGGSEVERRDEPGRPGGCRDLLGELVGHAPGGVVEIGHPAQANPCPAQVAIFDQVAVGGLAARQRPEEEPALAFDAGILAGFARRRIRMVERCPCRRVCRCALRPGPAPRASRCGWPWP